MPEGEDFDAACLAVDLVVEVVPGSTQEEAPDALLPCVASTGADTGLGRDQLEGPLKVFGKGQWGRYTVRPPPRRRAPDLCRGTRRGPNGEACGQGLLT
jgi:hypothetical protein